MHSCRILCVCDHNMNISNSHRNKKKSTEMNSICLLDMHNDHNLLIVTWFVRYWQQYTIITIATIQLVTMSTMDNKLKWIGYADANHLQKLALMKIYMHSLRKYTLFHSSINRLIVEWNIVIWEDCGNATLYQRYFCE